MTVEIHFILHVANGIHIIILKLCYSITYTYSNTVLRKNFHRTTFFLLLDVILDSDWLIIDCNVLR